MGMTWTADSIGMGKQVGRSLYCNGTNIFAGTYVGVYRSTNNGDSWIIDTVGMGSQSVRAICGSSTNVFVGTNGNGIFASNDNGDNWVNISNGLTDMSVFSLGTLEDTLYAGTLSSGVWKMAIADLVTSVETEMKQTPMQYFLSQNFPNPFNPTTSIEFNLPTKSFVSLKVFDILGREVATMVSGQLLAGNHVQQWNANGMPSGVYFYRLQAGSYTETKKLVLLK
jgi:hypothetical protein